VSASWAVLLTWPARRWLVALAAAAAFVLQGAALLLLLWALRSRLGGELSCSMSDRPAEPVEEPSVG
jgi:chromate transport protein ChrA